MLYDKTRESVADLAVHVEPASAACTSSAWRSRRRANAIGTYARYAFAVPGRAAFGDYPHFGVWTDAYYMMAHAFVSTAGGYLGALFAAMDRHEDAGRQSRRATWQVISDPSEGGHMPRGPRRRSRCLRPGAPGIFVSLHFDGHVHLSDEGGLRDARPTR